MNDSILIIGGGIGGLFTGAFLAKNGCKVTVLEKNAIIGGGLQCFRRKGKIFDTGMHVMGGFEEGGTLTRICRYLGILDRLNIHHIDPQCMDEIRFNNTGDIYRIPSGRDKFVAYLSGLFPGDADGIKSYVDELYGIAAEVPLFSLNESPEGIIAHTERFTLAADLLIADHVANPRLREILAYLNPLYGGVKGHTPAYIHALINVLYIDGASRFVGGSQQLADALADVIRNGGGDVISNAEVTAIGVEDRKVTEVHVQSGEVYTADRYISAVHPVELLRLLPEGTFLRGVTKRLNEIPNSNSAFSLFLDLKPGAVPYIGHTCYYMDDYGVMWNNEDYDGDDWPKGFMYMTPPDLNQGEYATRMLVHCIMDYDLVRKWEDTAVGHRGEEYEAWKQSHVDMVMKKLENIFPGITSNCENIYAASPLTVRDYYHTKEGAIFGYRKDCENIMLSQIPVYTKLSNLLLTGQNVNLHGICGVPLTAINTAEAILGNNFLIREINK